MLHPCQSVEKRRERIRGPRAARIPIVAGGENGDHGRGFFPGKNRCLADFAAGIRRISAKSGEDSGGGGRSLLPRPPAFQEDFLDKLVLRFSLESRSILDEIHI